MERKIRPYDKSKIKAVTADEKEVRDILGFAEVDVILGNNKVEKVRMLVFKNSTNPCLIGRDVLATHKHHLKLSWERKKPHHQTNENLTTMIEVAMMIMMRWTTC